MTKPKAGPKPHVTDTWLEDTVRVKLAERKISHNPPKWIPQDDACSTNNAKRVCVICCDIVGAQMHTSLEVFA